MDRNRASSWIEMMRIRQVTIIEGHKSKVHKKLVLQNLVWEHTTKVMKQKKGFKLI